MQKELWHTHKIAPLSKDYAQKRIIFFVKFITVGQKNAQRIVRERKKVSSFTL